MKQFAFGAGFLMFISSLPADATNEHLVRLEPERPTPEKVAFMQSFGQTLPPVGYVTFCKEQQPECQPGQRFADRQQLDPAKARELDEVNRYVNAAIAPVTDQDLYGKVELWTYPTAGKGDCEDYVLLKRRMLIARGWPESTLLITVVRDENNEGHAVLTARTDQGDLVLDNKRDEILAWSKTAYTFIKQQSDRNPLVWTSLLPPDEAPQTTISASNSN
jgi:predicted transglutaminase-like cysteine proteinase